MMKLDAVGLFVADMEKTVAFYRDVFGMQTDWNGGALAPRLIRRRKYGRCARRCHARILPVHIGKGRHVEGQLHRAVRFRRVVVAPPGHRFKVATSKQNQAQAAARQLGVGLAYVADPDGNLIEISSFGGHSAEN